MATTKRKKPVKPAGSRSKKPTAARLRDRSTKKDQKKSIATEQKQSEKKLQSKKTAGSSSLDLAAFSPSGIAEHVILIKGPGPAPSPQPAADPSEKLTVVAEAIKSQLKNDNKPTAPTGQMGKFYDSQSIQGFFGGINHILFPKGFVLLFNTALGDTVLKGMVRDALGPISDKTVVISGAAP